MSRTVFIGLLAGVAGALISGSFAEARAPLSPPPTPTWSYLCLDANGAAEAMEKANRAGAKGWEMVAATSAGSRATWCFKQPSWARPDGAP